MARLHFRRASTHQHPALADHAPSATSALLTEKDAMPAPFAATSAVCCTAQSGDNGRRRSTRHPFGHSAGSGEVRGRRGVAGGPAYAAAGGGRRGDGGAVAARVRATHNALAAPE